MASVALLCTMRFVSFLFLCFSLLDRLDEASALHCYMSTAAQGIT
jgi:hypothetical protein